jgi:Ca2+-binding RTX toxin-like protein
MAGSRHKKPVPALASLSPEQPWHAAAAMTGPFRADAAGPRPRGAPPLANEDNYTTNDAATITGNLLANDTPGDVPLAVISVNADNGPALALDREIILASGARLRVNSDGSFIYNPNGAFNSLPTTIEVFSYRVPGNDSATVMVTVENPPNPIVGTDDPETLTGTPNDDVLDARGGDDIVNALGGNDSIDGGTGADQMNGRTGNDTYFVDNAGDSVTELAGEGYDIIIASVNYTLGAGLHVEELVAPLGRILPIELIGNELDNIIRGARGNDTLRGMAGNDLLDRGTITEGGPNTMVGGTGDDIYLAGALGGLSDSITELDGEGYDIVYLVRNDAFVLTPGAFVELIAPVPTANIGAVQISGNGLNNEIRGGQQNDQLNGGGGADTLIGFAGNDTYTIDHPGDVIVEQANGGTDTVRTSINYMLAEGSNLENLTGGLNPDGTPSNASFSLGGNSVNNAITGGGGSDIIVGGDGSDTLLGLGGDDSIYGEDGHDTIDGGTGADLMDGGPGHDTYFVDNAGDVVIEAFEANQPTHNGDIIVTRISFTLTEDQYIEVLNGISTGVNSINLTGNSQVQNILGSSGDNVLNGGGGADSLEGRGGDDIFYIVSGNETLVELPSQGRDAVYSPVSYILAAGTSIEILSTTALGGSDPINFAGNELAQAIYGNAGANIIIGRGGADYMVGLGGDDTYYLSGGNEYVAENAGEGRDVIYTSASYALAAGSHVEALAADGILGTDAINLRGNEFNNEVYGNNGANMLNGGGGAGDYLVGWGGDDVYLIFTGAEIIVENMGGGRDVVYTTVSYGLAAGTQVEVLSTDSIAGTNAINLTGNELNNEVYGNNGANLLNGGGGGDYLVGWGGNDTYLVFGGGEIVVENAGGGRDVIYSTVSYGLAAGTSVEALSTDSITGTGAIDLTGNELAQEVYGNNGANTLNGGAGGDYMAGFGGADSFAFTTALGSGNVDHLADFSAVDDTILLENAVFTGLANGALPTSAFVAGSAAADADDRIVYNSATGQIFFDADGNGAGAQVLFATVNAGTVLTAGDFMVI